MDKTNFGKNRLMWNTLIAYSVNFHYFKEHCCGRQICRRLRRKAAHLCYKTQY